MIRDIRIAVDFLGHPKRVKLSRLLDVDDAAGYLLNLWIRTAMSKPDGVLRGLDDMDIAIVAGWSKDPEFFCAALHSAGFLDTLPDGTRALHDWAENQPWVIGQAARSISAQKAALARHHGQQDEVEKKPFKRVEGPGQGAPVLQKMPEVGLKSAETMPQVCGAHAERIRTAMRVDENRNAPLLSSSSPPLKSNPPVPTDVGTSPRGGEPPYSKAFEAWWKEYPVKVKKPRAWRAWRKIKGVSAPELIKAVQAQLAAGHFMVGAENCIPHPSTWLNDSRWTDEIKAQAHTSAQSPAARLLAKSQGGVES